MDRRPPRGTLRGDRDALKSGVRGTPRFGVGNGTLANTLESFKSKQEDIEIQLISVLTIAFIGIPINIMCICVLIKGIRKRPSVFKVFLGFIAMATLCLFVLSLLASQFVLSRFLFEYGQAVHGVSVVFRYLRLFLDRSLSALVILISTNRLLLINWPLVARDFVIVKYPGRTALSIMVIVAVMAIPPTLESKRTQVDGDGVADTVIPYYTTVMTIFFNFILALGLIGINTILTVQYAKHIRRRQAILSHATRAASNTKFIYVGATVAMSVIYIINTIPTTIVETLKMLKLHRLGAYDQVYAKAQFIGFILNALSAACYGPIFLWTSKENREELMKRLPCVGDPERHSQTK